MRDTAWIKLIVSGDRAAGEQFVSRHYPIIYRMLRHLTNRADVAEDLTQQTFVEAWKALASYRGKSSLSTWLHSIAYHQYTHWLRARHDHAPLEEADRVAAPQDDTLWGSIVLPRALAQLSAELRETFLLYHIQELSVPEIALVLEIPRGTVKSRLFVARQRLRDMLRGTVGTESVIETAPPARVSFSVPIESEGGPVNELSAS